MPEKTQLEKRLEALGWGLFFVWVGLALVSDLGWGIGLLGVGIITLGIQAARRLYEIRVEGFWLVVGAIFLIGGIVNLVDANVSLGPIALIIAGVAILLSLLRREKS